jgi:hypothetical protein
MRRSELNLLTTLSLTSSSVEVSFQTDTKGVDKTFKTCNTNSKFKNKPTNMKKATQRPTAALRQQNQALLDRKAAAAERRAERAANVETVTQQNARMYANVGR